MNRKIEAGDYLVELNVPWDSLRYLKVRRVATKIEVGLLSDYLDKQDPELLPLDAPIFPSPYRFERESEVFEEARHAHLIENLASAFIRERGKIAPQELLKKLLADPRVRGTDEDFINGCLRLCVVRNRFLVSRDRRRTKKEYFLGLSVAQQGIESARQFAASFANELQSLSERVKLLVTHTTVVGTYRENLLQSLLRKHLPERYHVATGFVLGCPRQIDVLIYDCIDYAPIFREDDVVVVPPQSVRAVIEVKTTLTAKELRSSLSLVSEVSGMDDAEPPFFKGIFAFDSPMAQKDICQLIVEFHKSNEIDEVLFGGDEVSEEDEDERKEDDRHLIARPYDHFTCVCVRGKAFAHVRYLRSKPDAIWKPTLTTLSSVSGLDAQASYFLQELMAYLQSSALKQGSGREFRRMLGADTLESKGESLTDYPEWGAYFRASEGMSSAGEEEVQQLEDQIARVEKWLNDGEPFEPTSLRNGGNF